jgi:CrcB protein
MVGLGGCVGSLARYGISLLAQRLAMDWPLGTFVANCLGCLAIGVIVELAARGGGIPPEVRLLLATGFCGGFTTMSSLVYEAGQMLRAHELLHASTYVAGTVLCSLAAFFAGVAGVRVLMRMVGALWS